LSTLTKILVVLLTVSSIFLCGLVATYVANADNYRQRYEQASQQLRAARENERSAQEQLRERTEQMNREKAALSDQIATLNAGMSELKTKLANAERERDRQLDRADKLASDVDTLTDTNKKHQQLLATYLSKLETAEANLTKEQSRHKETSATLVDKMAIISSLEEANRRLIEERAELQAKLDQFLRQYGRTVAPAEPVTPITAKARPARVDTTKIGLRGQVTNVDLKYKMATISIGSTHGVQEGMKFHIVRNDQYICDILILDAQPEAAVGALELMEVTKNQPKVGDLVRTNL